MIKKMSYSGLKKATSLLFAGYLVLGIKLLLNVSLRILLQPNSIQYYLFERKHRIIKKWLKKRYGYLIPETVKFSAEKKVKENKIWIFWWQGKENMPPVIQACYESVVRYSNGNEVILISKHNYFNYVEMPVAIIKKVSNQEISIAHFSDLLRISLLYKWGGLWIDSTFYLTANISDRYFNSYFGSIKLREKENWSVTRFRWTVGIIGSFKDNTIMRIMQELLTEYYQRENVVIDYLLTDYFFDILIDKYPNFKKNIDDAPYTNKDLYSLGKLMNDVYPEKKFLELKKKTNIFRITYKNELKLKTDEGEETFYSCIINNKL